MNKFVLILSFMGTIFMVLFNNSILLGICVAGSYSCVSSTDRLEKMSFIFALTFLFSLLTYWLPRKYFVYWWNFAKWAIPVIFLINTAIILELHHSDTGQMQDLFDAPIMLSLYTVFIVGSVLQLYRARKNNYL
jgi:hypothetical protein